MCECESECETERGSECEPECESERESGGESDRESSYEPGHGSDRKLLTPRVSNWGTGSMVPRGRDPIYRVF